MRLAFDIEANNLLLGLSKFHCAGVIDIDTNKEYWFRAHQSNEFLELLDEADTIIAHNALGYDVPALTKLFDWKPKATVHCTKVMSQLLNYKRFGHGHSLKKWGQHFNSHKIDYQGGFEEFNEDMFEYMKQDVRLLVKVYRNLMSELNQFVEKNGKSVLSALRSEMDMDLIMSEQILNGWKFNVKEAKNLLTQIDSEMQRIANEINPHLKTKTRRVDDAEKKLKVTKAGRYHAHILSWFRLDSECSVDGGPIFGDYSRVEFVRGDIGNTDTVKHYLYGLGWKPDDWNWKKLPDGTFIKVSPKLTDTSLEPLGEVGKMVSDYYTLRSRKSIIEGWFEYIDENERLHGDVFSIGTPTFRQAHKIIANLPSAKAKYGPEVRSLFVTEKGYKLVSADSAACQLRLLSYYMNDPKFHKELMEGDIHGINAKVLDCTREQAKRFIFAYLYGAGARKLSGYIGKDIESTKKSINNYKKTFPKLARLIKRINSVVEHRGFIHGLDDRPICLGRNEQHKALNYLIQGAEAIIMKRTVVMIHEHLTKANIDFRILLFYHDEVTYEVREDQAEQAKIIMMKCFEEAPKEVGVMFMNCGDCKIGNNYYEVH